MRKIKSEEGNTATIVKNLGLWLRECLYLNFNEGARFSRILVRQLVKGNKRGEEVFFLEVPKKATESWCDTTSLEIYNRLGAEASTLGGLQKYAIYSFASDDFDNHISRFVLRVQGGEDEEDGEPLNSEGADKAVICIAV